MDTIERVPVVQQVVKIIREFILSGQTEVGKKLPTEKEYCESLNVGRGTLREALRILQANGLVEIKPGRGAFVARTEEADSSDIVEWFVKNEVELKDCIEVRSAIEPLAIKLAISRCSDSDITQLERTHAKFTKAVEEDDILGVAKYDERFHNQIVEMSKNKLLISINKKVSEYVQTFRSKTFQVHQNVQNAIEPHSNIMRAMQERDSEAGELYMRKHIQRILEDLTVMIKK
jgi:GntR family transcriptional regulator, transcriptional repressor for pyruvate dehydrogenase complex